jgi:hypothetical protein
MARAFLRWLWLLAVAALVLAPGVSHADEDRPLPPTPRDVVEVLDPAAAPLGPLPSDFKTIEHGWLTLELPASVDDRAPELLREADEFKARLTQSLAQPSSSPVLAKVLVRIGRDPEQMAELAPRNLPPPRYATGVAYGPLHLAVLALQAPQTFEAPNLVELLRHELTHLALSDAVQGRHVPRWFDEGLAIHESGELPWDRWKTLSEAVFANHIIPLGKLDQFASDGVEVTIAYAESADFVRFLLRDSDQARFASLVDRLRRGATFDRALEDAYGTDLRRLEYEWREDMSHRFSVVPMLTGGGVLWALMALLAVVAWVKRRKRAKEKLAEWAREEAALEAAEARAREQPMAEAEDGDQLPPRSMPGIPVVEHEGRWYTVH